MLLILREDRSKSSEKLKKDIFLTTLILINGQIYIVLINMVSELHLRTDI